MLVLPLNFDSTPSPQLVRGTEILEVKVVSFLSQQGFDVRQLRLSVVTADWMASQEEVGGLESSRRGKLDEKRHETAVAAVVRRALARSPVDAVVVPTLVIREARYDGQRLKWDGVTRADVIDMSGTTRALAYVRGTQPASSLLVAVYDRSGRKFFERHAGIEGITRIVTSQDQWQSQPRSDLFENDQLLEGSVRMAFEPWLVEPGPATP